MENGQEPERTGNGEVCSGYAEARTAPELNSVFAGNIAGNLAAIEAANGTTANNSVSHRGMIL